MRTLLVFAKEPKPGRVKTRLAFAVGDQEATRIYEAFLADTARWVSDQAELAVHWWVGGNPRSLRWWAGTRAALHRQPSGDLGRRLAAAFRSAFAGGGGPVVAIGTDCPLFGAAELTAVFSELEQGADLCAVPAEDGGYVAIGLAAPTSEVFEEVPWSTPRALEATLARARTTGLRTVLLDPLYDVDTWNDLLRLAYDLVVRHSRAPTTARVVQDILSQDPDRRVLCPTR
jgi:rSAM/selenodomain-associated transferase 1